MLINSVWQIIVNDNSEKSRIVLTNEQFGSVIVSVNNISDATVALLKAKEGAKIFISLFKNRHTK